MAPGYPPQPGYSAAAGLSAAAGDVPASGLPDAAAGHDGRAGDHGIERGLHRRHDEALDVVHDHHPPRDHGADHLDHALHLRRLQHLFVDFSTFGGSGPTGGYCKAAAECCETVHGDTSGLCSQWSGSGMPVEGCKQALEGYKTAAKGCE
jgi:hypothetical protein